MNQIVTCPICAKLDGVSSQRMASRDVTIYTCRKVCGEYGLTRQATHIVDGLSEEDRAKISAYLRERNIKQQDLITLTSETPNLGSADIPVVGVNDILRTSFPSTISERLDRALLNLRRLSPHPGAVVLLSEHTDYPVLFAENTDAFHFIRSTLQDMNYIQRDPLPYPATGTSVILTAQGWNRIIELERAAPTRDSRQAFVAMWFDGSLDKAYSEGIVRAIREAGYEPVRVDLKEHNGKICDAIIAEIRKSRFVVADFTGGRGGVYYEAGYAMGIGIPVIWTCSEKDKDELHFDTRQYNHIIWMNETDLYEKLRRRIQATI